MSSYFTRERFGSPQFIAGLIILGFLGQCIWFCSKAPLSDREVAYILQGRQEWQQGRAAFHDQPSPITGLVASLPLISTHGTLEVVPPSWRWLSRLPFMIIGALFGASVWYVARRLYGNIAGYIALVLYSFSPIAITRAATVQPDVIADWGAFGIIFTAIGLAHTLYAPREVVLWNWKRIVLLGLAIGLACAAQVAVIVLVPVSLAFMWYLAPERRGAATVIMLAGCAIGAVVLLAAYGFQPADVVNGIRASRFTDLQPEAYANPLTYSLLALFLLRQPTVFFLLCVSVATYFLWKRVRFFGTTAPLPVFALILLLGTAMPHQGGLGFYILALPFAYVFIAGVMTDLLESRWAPIALGVIAGVLIGHGILSITGLIKM
jgi:4-amino-4-deoxy-L-arabinose transferase-like glycosyltransferase